MIYLAITTLMWAFSFGLIGRYLTGFDAVGVAFIRMLIALLVFLPLLRRGRLTIGDMLRLAGIGAVQYGLMYATYIHAFRSLAGHEVALFTIFTPLFVTLVNDVRRGRFHGGYLLAALLATAGAAVLTRVVCVDAGALQGVLLIQVSNLCFAAGQVEYKLFMERRMPVNADHGADHFGFLYLGAVLVTGLWVAGSGALWTRVPTVQQWVVFAYLGLVPSAIGFFLWNLGARRVNAGTLAVFNNVKIPLAMIVSLTVFREKAQLLRLIAGGVGIAAGFAAARWLRSGRIGFRRGSR